MKGSFIIDGKIKFTPKNHTLAFVDNDDRAINLGQNESRLLLCFLLNNDIALSRAHLMNFVWNERDIVVDDSSLTQAVSTLRKSLGDSAGNVSYIKTIPKYGYEFIGEVTTQGLSDITLNVHRTNVESPRAKLVNTYHCERTDLDRPPFENVNLLVTHLMITILSTFFLAVTIYLFKQVFV